MLMKQEVNIPDKFNTFSGGFTIRHIGKGRVLKLESVCQTSRSIMYLFSGFYLIIISGNYFLPDLFPVKAGKLFFKQPGDVFMTVKFLKNMFYALPKYRHLFA